MKRLAFWLTVCVVFTLPWELVVEFSGVGTISRVAGLAAAGVWGLAVLATGRVRAPTTFHLVALLFLLWNALSIMWSLDVDVSIGRTLTFAQLLVMVYLIWDTARDRTDVRRLMQAYVLGASVTVVLLIQQYLVHEVGKYQVRFTVGSFQFNDLGLVIVLGVPLAWYLGSTGERGLAGRLLQLVNLVHVPVAVIAVMLSGSRAAMVALAPVVLYMLVTLARLRPVLRVGALAGVVGLFLLMLPLVPPGTLQRLVSTEGDRSQGDLDGRIELWRQALLTFQEHPLTGVGTAAFREPASDKVAHNVWLRLAAELGLPGLLLFALLVVTAISCAWATRATVWVSALSALAVGATFYNFEDKKQTWFLLACAITAAFADPAPPEAAPPPLEQAARPELVEPVA